MDVAKRIKLHLLRLLALAVMGGLVACAGAGYPVASNQGFPVGTAPSPNVAAGTAVAGSAPGSASGPSVPGTMPTVSVPPGYAPITSGGVPGGPTGGPYPVPQPMPQPNMPPGIIGFFPPNGIQVCPMPRVVLAVQLTDSLRTNGAFDPAKVSLTLDGQDILSQIQLIAPLIYPQSQVTLSYVAKTPLALGSHQVRFTYPGTNGPIVLVWNFIVANIACQ